MPFKLNFLQAASPLTKTITKKADGSISKSAYPHIINFTSETLQISTLQEFHTALTKRAFDPRKPCLLKGQIKQPLQNESRAGSTTTNEATQWVCLDMDNAKFSSPEEVMRALGLGDISYVVQYSSSYRVENTRLSCHIFLLLSKALPAKVLKAWLMKFNLTVPALETTITLSPSEQALHWPLDITTCQNDKLLYIGAPIFIGMKSPLTDAERIKLVIKAKPHLDITTIEIVPIEAMKKLERAKLNQLRDAKGLKPQNTKVKQVGEFEVQTGAGEIANYQEIDCGEYVRFNLNGGDSQAYWHKKGDLQYLHNFKGEPTLILKEVLPGYYAEKVREQRDGNLTPATKGDLILCFQDKVTDGYWWGTWNPETNHLDLNTVSNETKLSNAVRSFGIPLPDPVPIWQRKFDPQSDVRVDEDARIVNIFEPTRYMFEAKSFTKGSFPIIQRLLDSAAGVGPIQDHFINWLATIWQYRVKPLTSWVWHGVEGTGKGAFFNRVIRPLFGDRNVAHKLGHELNEMYNGWMESSLIALFDEIDAEMFMNLKLVEGKLRLYITEPTVPIRRMRTDVYSVPSYTGFLFFSNKPKPVGIPPSDRRTNVGQFQKHRLITTAEELDKIEGELEAFAAHLSAYKAEPNRAAQVMQTDDRKAIQDVSLTSLDEIANAILEGNIEYFWEYVSSGQGSSILDPIQADYNAVVIRLTREVLDKPRLKMTREDMFTIFKLSNKDTPTGNKFAYLLRHKGIRLKRMRGQNDLTYGMEIPIKIGPELRKLLVENLTLVTRPHHLKGVAK
jgi:hypothetical protein